MRKSLLGFILSILSTTSFSQLKIGDVLVDMSYGVIGGARGYYFANFENNNLNNPNYQIDYNATYLGPAGVRVQYTIANKFGLGFEGNYTYRYLNWQQVANDPYGPQQTYNYTVTQTVMRLMLRTSWEFINEERFNMNWANSIGYRQAIWSGDNNYNFNYFTNTNGTNQGWPLAFRTAIGMRVWLHPNFGLNGEIGFSGGAFMNIGLSGRIPTIKEEAVTQP